MRSADRASWCGSAGPGIHAARSADAVKSPYYQADRERSSTLRYVLADLTETRAAAAYAALVEIERLAALLVSAPDLTDRIALADMIAQRHARFRDVLLRYAAHDPSEGMASAAPALDDARRRVESMDWWEGLAAVALSTPLTDELFAALADDGASGRPVSADAGPAAPAAPAQDSPELAPPVLEDAALADAAADSATRWAADQLRSAIGEDPVLAARLALWGRRLVGESIALARVFGGERYRELAEQLATSHARRLGELGLAG